MIAFFDFDDTLMCGDSILYWNCFLFEQKPHLRKHRWIVYLGLVLWCVKIISTHTLKRFQLKATSHLSEEERTLLATRFVREVLPKFLYPEMIARMKGHRAAGHRVVVVSASADFYMNQTMMSQILPCDEVVGTQMVFPTKGLFRIPKYTTENFKGPRKVELLRSMDQFPDADVVPNSYGYSDHYSDRFLLEYTEFPQAVHPDQELEAYALEKNWPIWRPFRLKNGKTRSWWKLQMLVFAKGMEHNQVPTGLAWRSQMLGQWFESWKAWVLGEGQWSEFWYLSQTLKGIPLELALEEIWLRHKAPSLPLVPTAQYREEDILSLGNFEVGEILPYSTWRKLKPELIQDGYEDVKIPVPGVREMMGLDSRFIENSLKLNSAGPLQWNSFFEARLERQTQLLKKDYQAEKEVAWMKTLNSISLPKQLHTFDFRILEVGREPALVRTVKNINGRRGINFTHQVESRLVDIGTLDEFVKLMRDCLRQEIIPEFRFGQVWRYVAGDWLALDPNALYPVVVGAGHSFCDWLEDTSNYKGQTCFEGVDFKLLSQGGGDAQQKLEAIFAPLIAQVDTTQFRKPQEPAIPEFSEAISQDAEDTTGSNTFVSQNQFAKASESQSPVASLIWNFYESQTTAELEECLGALNPFCFDIAMNLVEIREFKMKLAGSKR